MQMVEGVPRTTIDLPCISLWQPYASLIACDAKPFETRHWAPPERLIGRRVAIHAAARKPTQAERDELWDAVEDALGFCHWHLRIPYGAVVCTARLAQAWQVARHTAAGEVHLVAGPFRSEKRIIRDDDFGDYTEGRWCWELQDVRPLPAAVPARGAQGWWTWKVAA